jgi:uncharacterized surface protein with fasciclin (FAS1) repeats
LSFIICHISLSVALSGCAEWNDHFEGEGATPGSNLTLWQQLQANPQLSDFCEVLQQTKVFRMHKKTTVSYADLLSGGQSFTVVAPVNGSFDKAQLLQLVQTNQGDSIVEKSFVQNHLARSLSSVTDDPYMVRLLNSKRASFGNSKISDVSLDAQNIHAKNGILHVASQPLEYRRSIYEHFCDDEGYETIGSVLRSFEEDYFDADASVYNGIVEGERIYVDSVVIERNRMLQNIGLINVEDSVYWVVAPSVAGWQKAWDSASKYFVYDASVLKRDSIQQYWTARSLMEDAIFNMTDQRSTEDSLVSVPYISWRNSLYVPGKPIYHVFKKPFAEGGILNGAEKVNCSNGVLYKVNEWPFTLEQTFFKELWSEGEKTELITEYSDKLCSYNVRREVADSISENSYLQIMPSTNTANWDVTFRVNNTLAGDYDICVVLLPKSVSNQVNPDMRPCKFRATIKYADATGKMQEFNCNKTTFVSDPEKVDTIVLAENFHFPVCNYDQSAIKATVTLTCYISAKETSRYDREMYLDCIYLRPRISKAE